ncbi:hypothetical protein ACP275_12G046900 [Erythranthe tilingii]
MKMFFNLCNAFLWVLNHIFTTMNKSHFSVFGFAKNIRNWIRIKTAQPIDFEQSLHTHLDGSTLPLSGTVYAL